MYYKSQKQLSHHPLKMSLNVANNIWFLSYSHPIYTTCTKCNHIHNYNVDWYPTIVAHATKSTRYSGVMGDYSKFSHK
jgi:hypothetical protein